MRLASPRLASPLALMCLCLTLSAGRAAYAGPFVTIEAVNDYSQCNGLSLSGSVQSAVGFRDALVYSGNPANYQYGVSFIDNNVWTTDFYDPEGTGCVPGNVGCGGVDEDDGYFDKRGTAFSYYAGHGGGYVPDARCDDPSLPNCQPCIASWQCGSGLPGAWAPIPNGSAPGFCRALPGESPGSCSYTSTGGRQLALGNCTAGPARGGRVNYTLGGWVNWGESSWSGAWGGAGTVGGTNVVVLAASFAEMSNRGQEVWPSFGGIHMLANVLVHEGDTADEGSRGFWFGMKYIADPASTVSQGWMDAVPSMPDTGTPNSRCRNYAQEVYGGGHGVNGCGGHIITSLGATQMEASSLIWENWFSVRPDVNDAKGTGYFHARWMCNFDCDTYPFAY